MPAKRPLPSCRVTHAPHDLWADRRKPKGSLRALLRFPSSSQAHLRESYGKSERVEKRSRLSGGNRDHLRHQRNDARRTLGSRGLALRKRETRHAVIDQRLLLQASIADPLIPGKCNVRVLATVREPHFVGRAERDGQPDSIEGNASRRQRRDQDIRKDRLVDVKDRRRFRPPGQARTEWHLR